VQYAATIDQICTAFGCLPHEARRELDEDPDRLVLLIMELRAYRAAHTALHTAKHMIKDLEPWEGNRVMDLVQLHAVELKEERQAELDG
jgi:hypothetical protein